MAVPGTAVYNAGVATTPDGAVYVQHTSGATIDSPTFTGQSAFATGSRAAPSITFTGSTAYGWWFGTNALQASINNASVLGIYSTEMRLSSGSAVSWSSGAADATATDVSMARLGAGSAGMFIGRWSLKQGAAVASASSITLGTDGNRFQISGTTGLSLIDNTGWQGGSVIVLHFQGVVTITHNAAASGNNKPIFLKTGANVTTAAKQQIMLQYDSTDATWYQINS